MTKKELQERVDVLGSLLFEAVHLLYKYHDHEYHDEEECEVMDSQTHDLLHKCQKEGIV